MSFAIAVGPPQLHLLHGKLLVVLRQEGYFRLAQGSKDYVLFIADITDETFQNTLQGLLKMILYEDRRGEGGLAFVQTCAADRVAKSDSIGGSEVYIVPYAMVTTRDGSNPVPADGGVEGGVVGTEDTTVKVGIVRVFLFDGTDMVSIQINIGNLP